MVQAGQQTKGTISKNKNNARIKAMRDKTTEARRSRQKYSKGIGGIKRRGE